MTRDINRIGKRKNTSTQKLINTIGLEEVKQVWIRHGMYKGAEELSRILKEYVSASTLRYLSQVCNWKRPVNLKSAIYVGVQRGTVPAAYYKHLIFNLEEEENVKI